LQGFAKPPVFGNRAIKLLRANWKIKLAGHSD